MAINRDFWLQPLTQATRWLCPSCKVGHFRLLTNSLKFEESKASRLAHAENDWEPDWINYRFVRRRSRRMTHFCSDRVTHTKTSLAPGQGTTRAISSTPKACKVFAFSGTSCPPTIIRHSPAPRAPCSAHPGGSLFVSKPGSFLASAEGFVALLKCDNDTCLEPSVVHGEGGVGPDPEDRFESPFVDNFYPLCVSPSPDLFEIAKKCPENGAARIRKAFVLSWGEYEACVNQIRIALELLLAERGVPRYTTSSGKRTHLTLHSRIDQFAQLHQRQAPVRIDEGCQVAWQCR
jgi:hypothetical protein